MPGISPGGTRYGAFAALASAALFGASTPLAKLLLGGALSPWLLAGLLYLGSGIGLALIHLGRHLGRRALHLVAPEAPLRAADLPTLAAVIIAGGVLGPVLLMAGLARTDAATSSLLLNLESLFTLAIAWTVFGENVDRRIAIGAAAILLGALVLSDGGAGGLPSALGPAAVAAACLAWAIDNNLTRKLSSADPLMIAMLKGLVAGPVNIALALGQGAVWPPLSATAAAGIVGLFGYGVSLILFILALRHIGAARTGAYFATAPFLGAVMAILLLGEPVTAQLVIAGVLMAVGLWLHLAERHEHEHRHDTLLHEHVHSHDDHHQHAHAPDDPPGEPHVHAHRHTAMVHRHPHFPDIHHRHSH